MKEKEKSELLSGEKEWGKTFDALSDFLFILDKDFRFVRVNEAFCNAMKKEPRELIGAHCYEILHGRESPWPSCPYKRLLKTKKVSVEEVNDTYLGIPLVVTTSPLLDDKDQVIGCIHLAQDVSERNRRTEEKDKVLHEYGERVKELNCLYGISKLSQETENLEAILQGAVDLLPPAWQYPKITCARIMVDEQTFVTDNFRETRWRQATDILVQREKVGVVEVYYLEEMPESDEGPFLKEERHLIIAVAEQLRRLIQRKQTLAERMKAEEALQGANEKWLSLMENTDDVIMVLDGKGIIQDINSSPLVVNQREVIGMSVYEQVPREQRDAVRESLQRVFKTGKPDSYEVSPIIQGIGTLWFNTKVVPIKHDEEIVSMILISSNITERKKAEEKIRLLSNIVQQTSEAIAVSDLAGKLVFSNSAWADMHGYEMKELTEKDVSIFYQKPEIVRLFEGKARSEGFVRGRIVHLRKNGSTFTTLSLLTLLKDERGKPMGIARTAKDIRRIVLDIRDVGILPKLAS